MLSTIKEERRLDAPLPAPQALACDGKHIWLSSRTTAEINVLGAEDWLVKREYKAPGTTYGFALVGAELRAVTGEENDDRYLRRFDPESGFVHGRIPLPEDTGSYLGYGNGQLYLTQWYKQRLLAIDDNARVSKTFGAPHEICGCAVVNGSVYLMTTDDEETTDYFVTRVDLRSAEFVDVAHVPFKARSLAWDGERFWTNHREADQTVAFTLPSGAP